MKYVRTKDGRIIDFTRLFISMVGRKPYAKETVGFLTDASIIKESDNIDELFDEVVAVLPDGEHLCEYCHRLKNGNQALEMLEEGYGADRDRDEIYGAIWTNKGLIYVAKMNEKGEWELL